MSPAFRADHVGSLLRPPDLKDAFRRRREGTLGDADFRAAQDRAVGEAVRTQEAAGLSAITDGELRRASYWAHFVDAVDGLEVRPALFSFRGADGEPTAFTAPHVVGRLRRRRPISGEELAFLRRTTSRTAKVTMPSPSTMQFYRAGSGREPGIYASDEELFADLAPVYREEIAELARAGCGYVQLDEVALAMLCDPDVRAALSARGLDPRRLLGLYLGAIAAALAGRPAGLHVALHLCRGNYKGKWMSAGGYEPVAERLFAEAPVDAFLLEYDSPRAGDFSPLRFVPAGKRVVLGLVSTKTPVLEEPGALRRRIDEAARVLPLERLALSPQCGFASTVAGNPLTLDDQRRKLDLVVDVARATWGEP